MAYVFNPFTGNFDAVPDPALIDRKAEIEVFDLTSDQILAKRVVLANPPLHPERTLVQLETGIAQYANRDFYVVGAEVRWDNLAMELLVEPNQKLHVTYQ
jgi:hypothetical protein